MPRAVRWVYSRAIPILSVGIVLVAIGVVSNSVLLAKQARAGDLARDRQCLLAPTYRPIVEAAYRDGDITREALDAYLFVGLPTGCPPRAQLLRELKVK